MRERGWTFSFVAVVGLSGGLCCAPDAAGATPDQSRPADNAPSPKAADDEGTTGNPLLSRFLEQIVRDQLQTEYVDDDDWGKIRRVTVGHKITGKPFQWELEPRKKVVNDGLWEKYVVRLVDPDQNLDVRMNRLEFRERKLEFSLGLTAKLAGDARLERWRQGLKMLNAHIEAVGTADVELVGEVGFRFTTGNALPAVAIEPRITDLDIQLKKFKLKRVSKLEGGLAHELGDGLKDTIQRELNRREPKIIAKLNRSIDKRKDRLVLSVEQFAKTGWSQFSPGAKSH